MNSNLTVVTMEKIKETQNIVEDTKEFIREGHYSPEEIKEFIERQSISIAMLPKRRQMEISWFFIRYIFPLEKYSAHPSEDIQLSISNVEMGYGEPIDEIFQDAHDALELWYEISDNLFTALERCYIKVGEVIKIA